ncbi:peptidase M3, partial [Odoribacter sp. OttesenSCG-928-J03]|nr:peptidase M3 [Odoribacter sp. OttesenSCG-928-J03]
MKKTIVMIGLAAIMGACSAPKEKNPFFSEYNTPYGVPPFDKIEFEHYKPAFERGMEEQRKEVEAIINNKAAADFENTIAALDQSGGLLRRVSAVFYGINGANTTDSIKALNRELSPLLSKHGDDINLNPGLFAKVKEVYAKKDQLKLTKEQSTLLEETYKSFVRGGANLNEEQQAELRKLNARISLLQITFEANVLDETNSFKLVL